jgi:hypothetical protein
MHMKNSEFWIIPNVFAIDILNTVLVQSHPEMLFNIERGGSTLVE